MVLKIALRRVLLVVVACSSVTAARAQDSGLYFLQLGPNAESMALGGAQVSFSEDAFATYWNPAGLASADRNSAAISHHIWVADVRTYAVATRLGLGEKGAVGFSVTATGTSDLEARDGPGDPAGLFSAQFLSVGASYGRAIGALRLGVTAKYLSEEIFEASADGYAFDFGAQARLLEGALDLGASFSNVGKITALSARSTRLPRMLRAGAAVHPLRILSSDDEASLLDAFALIEISHVLPGSVSRLHLGVGADVMELVTVRAGYVSNDELRSFSYGLGLEYEPFQVDYSFLPFERGFDGPGHVISLTYRW